MTRYFTALILGLALVDNAGAMDIRSAAPGNLFSAGEPMALTVSGAAGRVTWRLADWRGREAGSGTGGDAGITLPALAPGWYELTGRAGRDEQSVFLGVVAARKDLTVSASRVAADLAGAWLLKTNEQRRTVARMLRRSGIGWVRERLSWVQTEPAPGKFAWGKYDETATILSEEGLKICQVWHDTPKWTRSSNPDGHASDDLRSVHRFAREAAKHFRGRIQAWEIWNEPDIFFWQDLSDRYTSFVMAAALGLRAGDPDAIVLPGSLCSGIGPFARAVATSGALEFCDAFNWHLYKAPRDYPGDLAEYRALFEEHRNEWKPAWMTEAGIRLSGTEGEGQRLLGREDLRAQARFVPKSIAMSLAAGTARHFFFVIPDYLEKGTAYGALRPDLTPTPAFIALAASAHYLGESEYLGRVPVEGIEVRAFRAPHGLLVIAWSDAAGFLDLPAVGDALTVADLFGREERVAARGGTARLPVGPDAVYALGVGAAIERNLVDRRAPISVPSKPRTAGLALSARSALPTDKDRDARTLDGSATSFTFDIEVCRFGTAAPGKGALRIDLPDGWRADRITAPWDLPVDGRVVVPFRLTPAAGSLDPARVKVTAVGSDGKPAASVESRFLLDGTALEEAGSQPLPWSDPKQWRPTAGSGAGRLTVARSGKTGLRFTGIREPGVAGWWEAELDAGLLPELNMNDAISCTMMISTGGADDAHVYLMLMGSHGRTRMTGGPLAAKPRSERFTLRDMAFDAGEERTASRVRIGVWTGGAVPVFDAGIFSLVRLRVRKQVAK